MNFATRILAARTPYKSDDHYRGASNMKTADLGQRLYDFFRHNFSSVGELERKGLKEFEEQTKVKNDKYYRFKPEDLNDPVVQTVFRLAINDMYHDTPEEDR